MRYDQSEGKTKSHAWQYSSIGPGKKNYSSSEPNAPKFEEKVKFYDGGEKFGFVSEKRKNVQKKHVFSRSHHLQNCGVIFILGIIIMRKKMQRNLQGFRINGLKDLKELLNKEVPAIITQQMVNILNQTCCRWTGLYKKEHRSD